MTRPQRHARFIAPTALGSVFLSIAILIAVGVAGPSAGVVTIRRDGPWPPYFAHLDLPDLAVAAAMWAALLLGVAGLAAGLVAVRRGWSPRHRWLVAGALVAVAALAVVPAIGSTDMLDYAVYGRIAALHHSPYLMTPEQLRRLGDPVAQFAPHVWESIPSVYGPLATATEWAASELGGRSAALTVFWLKVWNALAFIVVVLVLDRLTRARPAMRARAHLLWSVNPLMLWAVLAGGHIDGLAIALAVLALAVLGPAVLLARHPGRIATGRALAAGLLLGAATAVKAPFVLFSLGLAWVARQSPRTVGAAAVGGAAVLATTYLAAGHDAITAVLQRGYGVAGDNLWQAVYRPFGYHHPIRHLTFFAAVAVVLLAVLLMAFPPPGARHLPAIWPALAVILAWTFTSPLQRPWFDVMVYVPLVFLPASRLDWVVLGRSLAAGLAYIPGVVLHLHPAWLQSGFITIITWVAPDGRLLALAALVVLCLTGAWRPVWGEPGPAPAIPAPARELEML